MNRLLILCICFFISASLFSQSEKQKELEEKRQSILNDIKNIQSFLLKTRGQKKSVLTEVEDLEQQIKARENLIRVTNQQANLLTREINNNLTKIDNLRDELATLKEDYAAMIKKSYKSKSQQSRVMFLFSSENFLQAYKRLQYMKQYTKHRKAQGESIKEKTNLLQVLNTDLLAQKKQKEKLIDENKLARKQLEKEQKNQEELIASLKKDEGNYVSQINKKQREANALRKEIDALIRAAIAEANKNSAGKTTTTAVKTKSSAVAFNLTPEAKEIASNFKSNRGKLIWPVEKGVVVNRHGKRRHPQFPNVTTQTHGVDIATEPNADVRAVFKGEVFKIQQLKGANKAIYIRHGDYITIYNNLSSVSVKNGDKVSAKQKIGKAFTHPTTGKAIIKFLVFKNTTEMNPEDWVYKM